jgi:hypothetical protein
MQDYSRSTKYVWQGHVERVDRFSFAVRMQQVEPPDMNRGDEFTTFSLSELSDEDQATVQSGSYFQWTITQQIGLIRPEPVAMTPEDRALIDWLLDA